MDTFYTKWWSSNLNQDMEIKVYGRAGKPVLVFPSMNGRFYEFEDFGMIHSVLPFIEENKIQVFTVDSIDGQSWTNWNAHPADRARRHEDYDRYIISEVVPFIADQNPSSKKILTTGCSMGGYHAINFFFRHPDCFNAVIGLSGVARLSLFIGDYIDETVYLNSPVDYLKNLTDEKYLNLYRQSQIILCAGQGDWEEPMIGDMRYLAFILSEKKIPYWLDLWGYDVVHDWPWWRKQLPYFLAKLGPSLEES
jgi:esterase/lipase superfamily enzyme